MEIKNEHDPKSTGWIHEEHKKQNQERRTRRDRQQRQRDPTLRTRHRKEPETNKSERERGPPDTQNRQTLHRPLDSQLRTHKTQNPKPTSGHTKLKSLNRPLDTQKSKSQTDLWTHKIRSQVDNTKRKSQVRNEDANKDVEHIESMQNSLVFHGF